MSIAKAVTLFLFILWSTCLLAQTGNQLIDGRSNDPFCLNFQTLISKKPKEVLLGVHIQEDGNVYFMMDNEAWFNKLFVPGMGITADIVSEDRYSCSRDLSDAGLWTPW